MPLARHVHEHCAQYRHACMHVHAWMVALDGANYLYMYALYYARRWGRSVTPGPSHTLARTRARMGGTVVLGNGMAV